MTFLQFVCGKIPYGVLESEKTFFGKHKIWKILKTVKLIENNLTVVNSFEKILLLCIFTYFTVLYTLP